MKTISRLAADALFGVSGNLQEHSETSSATLKILSYTGRGARQLCRKMVDVQVRMKERNWGSIGSRGAFLKAGGAREGRGGKMFVRSMAPRLSRDLDLV